jgi:hypothetical protein
MAASMAQGSRTNLAAQGESRGEESCARDSQDEGRHMITEYQPTVQ